MSTDRTPIDRALDALDWTENQKPLWHDDSLPWAKYEGVLSINGLAIRAYVLSDGRRILDGDDMRAIFGDMLPASQEKKHG